MKNIYLNLNKKTFFPRHSMLLAAISVLMILSLAIICMGAKIKTVQSEYKIGPGDAISITVFQNSDLSRSVSVDPDGTIELPLAGIHKVTGMTRRELHDYLVKVYKKYLVKPQLDVAITGYNNASVKVLGDIANPGLYQLRGNDNSLVKMIAQAGGTTSSAQLRQVTILRGKDTILEVDLYQILYEGKAGLDVKIQPDDTIFVPNNRHTRVIVLGQVQSPGFVNVESGLSVLEAITQAGGYNDGAKLKDVWVLRGKGDKPEILHVNIQDQLNKGIIPKNGNLKSGDIVFVHRGLISELNYWMDQVSPAMRTIILGDSAADVFHDGNNVQTTTSID